MISVALCTYNGATFIREQLESILQQTVLPDEIVITDDGSTDSTESIVEDIKRENQRPVIRWERNAENLGFVANFYHALALCSGDIIFLCDQDDFWKPDKIETMLREMTLNPDNLMYFHNAELVDRNRHDLQMDLWRVINFLPEKFYKKKYERLLDINVVQGSASVIRRELLELAKPYPKKVYHDEWLAAVAASCRALFPVDSILMEYRQTGENTLSTATNGLLKKLQVWDSQSYWGKMQRRMLFLQSLSRYDSSWNNGVLQEKLQTLNAVMYEIYNHKILSLLIRGCREMLYISKKRNFTPIIEALKNIITSVCLKRKYES